MERLDELVDFEVSSNKLDTFDVNISKWEKLLTIYRTVTTMITSYNYKALWTHDNVVGVSLTGNVGIQVPQTKISMSSLQFLHLGNNEMDLNVNFDTNQFPNLTSAIVNGNNLLTISRFVIAKNLFWLLNRKM